MTMEVSPGGAYFGLYSDRGDTYRGAVVSYADAVASAAAPEARDVADLSVPADFGNPNIVPTHPKLLTFTGSASLIDVHMTYDNGIWGDGDDVGGFSASKFLLEIQGPAASLFELGGSGDFYVSHHVSSDGGQSIYLGSDIGGLLDGITRIKVWRAAVFPGDPLPEPPGPFWTRLIGAREVV